MPIEFRERTNSPVIVDNLDSPDSIEQRYYAVGSSVEADVYAAAIADLPLEFMNLPRLSISLEWDGEASLWEVSVTYQQPSFGDGELGSVVTSFDTTGGTFRLTQSLATINAYGSNPPDFKGAIGVNGDSVDGVDIISPSFQFSETHYKPDGFVTQAYQDLLMRNTGTVNSDNFRGFAPGQVLFTGATASRDPAKAQWTITYTFLMSPNATNIVIAPGIVVSAKKGWEYLWVRYEQVEDTTARKIVKRPVAAYVERVYREVPFAGLNIGSGGPG